jgi:glutamyl-tRNA reductase
VGTFDAAQPSLEVRSGEARLVLPVRCVLPRASHPFYCPLPTAYCLVGRKAVLTLAGISYKTAPVEVREGFALTTDELGAVLPLVRARFGPAIVLSTCNRTEIYLGGDGVTFAPGEVFSFLAEQKGLDGRERGLGAQEGGHAGPPLRAPLVGADLRVRLDPGVRPLPFGDQLSSPAGSRPAESGDLSVLSPQSSVLSPSLDPSQIYTLDRADAVRHLFRVAAGLESMILGELQVLGQVRGAVLAAEQAQSADRLLVRLFQSAIAAGRKARAAGLGRYAASVSGAAVALAREVCGDLSRCSVLIVSAGEAGKLTAQGLLAAGAGRVSVTSRTLARAEALASQLGGATLTYDRLGEGIAAADIVISATGSRGFQIDASMVERAMNGRTDRPLLLIDLAVPRDIDPAVRHVNAVRLYDIDDLQFSGQSGAGDRLRAVEAAERLVEIDVERFLSWWQGRRAVPTIAALRDQAEAIRRSELAKTLDRLPNLSDEERDRIDALTAAIVNKLLHQPITRLKQREADALYLDAVSDLFALESGAAD